MVQIERDPRLISPAGTGVSEPPSAARRRAPALVLGLIGLVLVGAMGVGIANHWDVFGGNNNVPAGLPSAEAQLAALTARLAASESRLATLESPPVREGESGVPAELAMLRTRFAEVEAELARSPGRDALSAVDARLLRLEGANSGSALRRVASALALANLARAAESAMPFRRELDQLALIAPGDPALKEIGPYAEVGVSTLASLKARLPEAVRASKAAEQRSAAEGDFLGRLWARLGNLISIRRLEDSGGNTSADRLARAGAALERDDLNSALEETRAITGAAGGALAPWIRDAEARLATDRALAELQTRIVQALTLPPNADAASGAAVR